jgi:hypothetical protein
METSGLLFFQPMLAIRNLGPYTHAVARFGSRIITIMPCLPTPSLEGSSGKEKRHET